MFEHKLARADLTAAAAADDDDDAEGTISGYGAVFGNTDLGGDIILPGAFRKSLALGRKVRMLRQHYGDDVIGVWSGIVEDKIGLRMTGQLATATEKGRETYELIKMGALDGLSVGYRTIVLEFDRDTEIRTIKEAELWEVSIVTFPMNESAVIDAVKAASMTAREIERKLTQDAGFTRSAARALMRGGIEALGVKQDADTQGLAELAALLRRRVETSG